MKGNKKLKFEKSLVKLILSGEKTSTWRLFDDKNLKVGDNLELLEYESGETFVKAEVTKVYEKTFIEIKVSDFDKHEKYENKEKMLETYRGYYGDKVNWDTIIKIIEFKLVENS